MSALASDDLTVSFFFAFSFSAGSTGAIPQYGAMASGSVASVAGQIGVVDVLRAAAVDHDHVARVGGVRDGGGEDQQYDCQLQVAQVQKVFRHQHAAPCGTLGLSALQLTP